jgi:hypothetical protein
MSASSLFARSLFRLLVAMCMTVCAFVASAAPVAYPAADWGVSGGMFS